MKTLLIFPPAADPANPPLGIAALTGFLKANKKSVSLFDLNILSYHFLLSKKNLKRCGEKAARRFKELNGLEILSPEEAKEYSFIIEGHLAKKYLPDAVEGALAALQSLPTYSSRTGYGEATSSVRRGMELVSAVAYPTRWSPRTFSMRYSPVRSQEVLRAIDDRDENIFIPFYEFLMPEFKKISPDLIGVSVNYYCQLIPAMTLAALLKKVFEDSLIVVGGALLPFFDGQWESFLPFRGIIDGLIPYQGEEPLLALVRAVEQGRPVTEVPGIAFLEENRVEYNPLGSYRKIEELPLPDFGDLPLDRYLAPRRLLPYAISRGCYWGRCAFCSHKVLHRHKFDQKLVEQIVDDLDALSERYGAEDFYFVDEAISPATAHKLSLHVKKKNLPYGWFGEMRLESALDAGKLKDFSEGGCRMLLFGLESGVSRVLRLMGKGTVPDSNSRILNWCSKVGIKTFIMFIVGFPTERKAETLRTIEFIEAHKDHISHVAFGNFLLMKGTPVFNNPSRYGISKVTSLSDDLAIYADYEVIGGMSREVAEATVEDIKNNTTIRSLASLELVSRSHLVFLPNGVSGSPKKHLAEKNVLDTPEAFYPKVVEGVKSVAVNFNLEKIRVGLKRPSDGNSTGGVGRSVTNYLYEPRIGKLVEVGEDGLWLIKPCTGEFSLQDIISSVGKQNTKAVRRFYSRLRETGFLELLCESPTTRNR